MSELLKDGDPVRGGRQLPTPYLSQVRRTVDRGGLSSKDCSFAFLTGWIIGALMMALFVGIHLASRGWVWL